MIAIADLYWIAGFLEGEGCFHTGHGQLRTTASQKQREPLERLQGLLGGKIYRRRNQPIWEWWLCGPPSAGVMMTLYWLLSARRRDQIRRELNKWRARPLCSRWRSVCLHGHPYTTSNTIYWLRKPTTRICRECALN